MKSPSNRERLAAPVLAFACTLALLAPTTAFAYIGPGAGITMIGTLIGIVVVIAGTIGAILYWPVRAMLRKRKKAAQNGAAAGDEGSDDSGAGS